GQCVRSCVTDGATPRAELAQTWTRRRQQHEAAGRAGAGPCLRPPAGVGSRIEALALGRRARGEPTVSRRYDGTLVRPGTISRGPADRSLRATLLRRPIKLRRPEVLTWPPALIVLGI